MRGLAAIDAIGENAHHFAALQTFLHAQHRARLTERDDLVRKRVSRHEQQIAQPRAVIEMHYDVDRQLFFRAADDAEHFEAAQMRAEQQASASLGQRIQEHLLVVHVHAEVAVAPVDEIDAVEQCGGKHEQVHERIAPGGSLVQRAVHERLRGAARKRCGHEEIAADGYQQHTARRAAAMQSQPDHEPQRLSAAALALAAPLRAHAPAGATTRFERHAH